MFNIRKSNIFEGKALLLKALEEYLSLKFRVSHPEGKFDNKGRWYPSGLLSCCLKVNAPTHRFPYSYMTHCRTRVHIATKYNIELKDLQHISSKKTIVYYYGYNNRLDLLINRYLNGKSLPER
jgi:hypothetical protein